MERKGSKAGKRNERCFKGEGASSSDQSNKKRKEDHAKEATRVSLKIKKEGEGGRGNIIYLRPSGNHRHLLPTS